MMTKGRDSVIVCRKHSTKEIGIMFQWSSPKSHREIYQKNMSCGYPRCAERDYGS